MNLVDRFLKYVSFDTQSDPDSDTYPSTSKQLAILNHLVEEMILLGLTDVEIDANGYAMGTIPATVGYEDKTVIGFISHVDTSPDMSGANVCPQIIENYDGENISLNEDIVMRVSDFPELAKFKGHTLITTDGTTLLGADDKAGIAEIMTAAEYLLDHPEIAHGKIRIGFTPDEEIGHGVEYFDVERFGAKFAYTLDGGFEGEYEYENFNAASAKITINGRNIHPGSAKDKMINAIQVATEFNAMLPHEERPEYTSGYEGFFHVTDISGTVELATIEYIIRDYSKEDFLQRKNLLLSIVASLSEKYGVNRISIEIEDQYYNMREMIEPNMEIVGKIKQAMTMAGVTPILCTIRGGTDGARLSYMGLPCPNIFTGGMNFHGRYEYCSVDSMERAVRTIVNLVELWAK